MNKYNKRYHYDNYKLEKLREFHKTILFDSSQKYAEKAFSKR